MKLSSWAKQNDIHYLTAYRWFKAGKMPVPTYQTPSGAILVQPGSKEMVEKVVALYARVSSHDQKDDLDRQLDRLKSFCSAKGWKVSCEKKEIGSGLNGKREGLLKLLEDPSIQTIVIEHRDRLSRFGFDYILSSLKASNRDIVVIDETEIKDDLVRDFIEIVTSFCARIYGNRSAKNKRDRILEVIK